MSKYKLGDSLYYNSETGELFHADGTADEKKITGIPEKFFNCLITNRGSRVSADELIRAGWDNTYLIGSEDVQNHIREIRKRLSALPRDFVHTERGNGYSIKTEDAARLPCFPWEDASYADYYAALRRAFSTGGFRDRAVKSGMETELVNYYQLPQELGEKGLFSDERQRLFITAPSGSGKTALLKMLALSQISDFLPIGEKEEAAYRRLRGVLTPGKEPYFPVYIRAADFNVNDEPDTADLLTLAVGKDSHGFDKMVEKAYAEKTLLLLIDGVDEVAYGRRDAFYRRVNALTDSYPAANAVMTSRFAGDSASRDWTKQPLPGLDGKKRKAIVRTLLGDDADEMLKRLENDPALAHLTENPFILTTILDSRTYTKPLTECLEKVITAIIKNRWETEKALSESNGLMTAIERVAFRYVCCDIDEENTDTVNRIAGIDDFVNTLSRHSGIFGLRDGMIVFDEPLVKIYLAAKYLLSRINGDREFIKYGGSAKAFLGNASRLLGYMAFLPDGEQADGLFTREKLDMLFFTYALASGKKGIVPESLLYLLFILRSFPEETEGITEEAIAAAYRLLIADSLPLPDASSAAAGSAYLRHCLENPDGGAAV